MGDIWYPRPPQVFVDRRTRLTRTSGLVRQNVRAYRGVLIRKTDGFVAHCTHAHSKPGAAKRCAEVEARRRNRAGIGEAM